MSENQNCNTLTKIVFAPVTWFILFSIINLCTTWFFTHKVTSVYQKITHEYVEIMEHIKTPAPKVKIVKGKPVKPAQEAKPEVKQPASQEEFERTIYQIQINWLNLWMIVLAIALGILGVAFPIMFAEQMKQYQESSDDIKAKTRATLKEIEDAHNSLKDLREAQSALVEIRRAELPQLRDNMGKVKIWRDEAEANALFSQGYYEEALIGFEKVIEGNPTDLTLFNYALVLERLKRNSEALLAYEKAIELNPKFAMAHNKRGVLLQDLGRDEEALAAYDTAISLKPDFAMAYFNRGTTLGKLGDEESNKIKAQKQYEEAAKALRKAITLNANFAEAYCNYGIALAKVNRSEEALEAYTRSIELEPNSAATRYYLGLTLENLERPQDALSAYNRAIFLSPNYKNAHLSRGLVLEKLGHYKEALASIEKSLDLDPDNKAAIKAQERLQGFLSDYQDEDHE